MSIKPTVQIGAEILETVCEPLENISSPETAALVADLVDTMRSEGLVGLAAPQLGYNARVFVMELRPSEKTGRTEASELYVCINPEIIERSSETVCDWEGCGSIARGTLFGRPIRNKEVELRYWDQDGRECQTVFDGLLSRVAQHENDHLDGIVFLARMEDPTDLYDIAEYRRIRLAEASA